MQQYEQENKKYYEKAWKQPLSPLPGATGWQTMVPASEFVDFVHWLKKEDIHGRVLDIGCGAGRHAQFLAQHGFQVYGIDFSPAAIRKAKGNALKENLAVSYRVGNALNLPYTKFFFAVVNDDGCLHHLSPEDCDSYRKGIHKVLQKGGIVRLKVFSRNCLLYKNNRRGRNAWILLPWQEYTYFFSKHEIKNFFGQKYQLLSLEEKIHPHTKEKKFWYALFQKR